MEASGWYVSFPGALPSEWHIVVLSSLELIRNARKLNSYISATWSCVTASTRRKNNVGLMLGQRHRRWPNIKPALDQTTLFAGVPNRGKMRTPLTPPPPVNIFHKTLNKRWPTFYDAGPTSNQHLLNTWRGHRGEILFWLLIMRWVVNFPCSFTYTSYMTICGGLFYTISYGPYFLIVNDRLFCICC